MSVRKVYPYIIPVFTAASSTFEAALFWKKKLTCVDNSDYMRNGDFVPTRMQAQQDAVNLVCMSKTRSNPENNVGLLKMAQVEVLVTLTSDVGQILAQLHQVQLKGNISFLTSVRVAHLALKHRQGKNHKTRIVVFIGSPIIDDEKEIVKTAKKLKKEKVNVDVINFGEEDLNTEMLSVFVSTINGKDGSSSHLVTVPPGPMLSDALLSSPVIVGEDGTGATMSGGYEFGVDPNEDPELALALRVSMEEQRVRQETDTQEGVGAAVVSPTSVPVVSTEEDLLEKALLESTPSSGDVTMPTAATAAGDDLSAMTEAEQIECALRMSMELPVHDDETALSDMDVDTPQKTSFREDKDSDFLQSVLENLPGVDPNSEAIKDAVRTITASETPKDGKGKGGDGRGGSRK